MYIAVLLVSLNTIQFVQSYFIYSRYDLYLNFLFFFVRQCVSDHLDEQTRSADSTDFRDVEGRSTAE